MYLNVRAHPPAWPHKSILITTPPIIPQTVLRSLYAPASPARPNARSFTILLAGLGKAAQAATNNPTAAAAAVAPSASPSALCASLYREAEAQGVACNGIMAHALLRAFGGDAPGALVFFKKELRVRLKARDRRRQEQAQEQADATATANGEGAEAEAEGPEEEGLAGIETKALGLSAPSPNLSLAYLALLHVCGLAGRADLALQAVYAMQRDGLRADARAWDAFASGKDAAAIAASPPAAATAAAVVAAGGAGALAAPEAPAAASSSLLFAPYESLLRAETLGWEGGETFFKRIRIRF